MLYTDVVIGHCSFESYISMSDLISSIGGNILGFVRLRSF